MKGLFFDRKRAIYFFVIEVKMEQIEADKKVEDLVIEVHYFHIQITKNTIQCVLKNVIYYLI